MQVTSRSTSLMTVCACVLHSLFFASSPKAEDREVQEEGNHNILGGGSPNRQVEEINLFYRVKPLKFGGLLVIATVTLTDFVYTGYHISRLQIIMTQQFQIYVLLSPSFQLCC